MAENLDGCDGFAGMEESCIDLNVTAESSRERDSFKF